MPSKKPSKVDSFDAWLKSPPRRSRVCQTCADGGEPAQKAARYVEAAKAGTIVPSVSQLHEHLAENGYRWTKSALAKHVRDCLGWSARS